MPEIHTESSPQSPSTREPSTQEASGAAKRLLGLGIAGALIAGGVAIASEEHNQNAQSIDIAKKAFEQSQQQKQQEQNSINSAVNAYYDAKDVVGEVKIGQGDNLITPSLEVVQKSVSPSSFEAVKEHTYADLQASAQEFNPQPGETYDVVKTDLDPQAHNGDEYIVVQPTHVIETDATSLPTPETH